MSFCLGNDDFLNCVKIESGPYFHEESPDLAFKA